jgi:hypothetical protein
MGRSLIARAAERENLMKASAVANALRTFVVVSEKSLVLSLAVLKWPVQSDR